MLHQVGVSFDFMMHGSTKLKNRRVLCPQMCVTLVNYEEALPLQAWSGPECSRDLRFPDFMTTAQDGGKVISLTHRPPLPPQEMLPVLISGRG